MFLIIPSFSPFQMKNAFYYFFFYPLQMQFFQMKEWLEMTISFASVPFIKLGADYPDLLENKQFYMELFCQ